MTEINNNYPFIFQKEDKKEATGPIIEDVTVKLLAGVIVQKSFSIPPPTNNWENDVDNTS